MTLEEYNYAIEDLNKATVAYDKGQPIMTDAEWDSLYFAVSEYEYWNGCSNPDSPTQKIHFETVSELKKVKHNHPMLSLNKTKDVSEVKAFIGDHDYVVMAKMDGLTCSLYYENGRLVSAETRGNGVEGEDITHNAMVISSIPKRIKYKNPLTIDGEIICTYDNFIEWADTYKNPRNFAAGSIRLLDSEECFKRNLTFVAWDAISLEKETLHEKIFYLEELGFEIVEGIFQHSSLEELEKEISLIQSYANNHNYPIDGVVFKYDNCKEYNAVGRTDHHFKGGLAYKFYDEEYETRLKNISYDVSRNGILTPVAVFEPINIDGTTVERASLHNMSVMYDTLGEDPYYGERIKVIKANQIIPQIVWADKRNYGDIVAAGGVTCDRNGIDGYFICPACGSICNIHKADSGVKELICENPQCEGKLIQRLNHFCGKKGLDIKGLSEKTLEKLVDWEWVTNFVDLFNLDIYKLEWISKDGFGPASVDKILNAIQEKTKSVSLAAFISALGIPLIGSRVAKIICEKVSSWEEFRELTKSFNFMEWDGFGPEMDKALHDFDYTEADRVSEYLTFEENKHLDKSVKLDDKIFVITGKLIYHNNRQQLINEIEAAGGKVASAVSSKTDYLVNNDVQSTSAKNKKALELKVPIITEEELMEMMEDE